MALPRKLKREINESVLELVEIDLTKETSESIKEKIQKVVYTLDRNSVSEKSDYRSKLVDFEEYARQFFQKAYIKPILKTNINNIKIDPDKRRIYTGFIDPFTFRVTINPSEYWLQGFPGKKQQPKTRLRWIFSYNGRLKNLECKIAENHMKLISVLQTNKKSDERQESEINVYPIPPEVLKLKPIFRNAEIYAIYQTMVYWGHKHSNNILENLGSERIQYLPSNPEEIPLAEMINDSHALKMIEATAGILPYIKRNGNGKYLLGYEKRE